MAAVSVKMSVEIDATLRPTEMAPKLPLYYSR